ncbi:MAG: class I SAM-dependent methyltransferase [Planctomycetaceae bacterium]|jgi:tellurite methyltransferase|nr:class I SAM-dependent methyltransferase [Planctomycetaceae bacterium]MDB4786715.1 class I SAM-dependent methyltransferase [Planctomycetaceae bacterium]MDC0274046.1 class I SAM-dependent methyltransferase [Planctomycetaceae bacterium]MDG2388650.1 class I SAM-dependent methyltransferase [Planctomycetaceae bacterium]
MTSADRDKWDRKYSEKPANAIPPADEWLLKCVEGLAPGRALDLACGLGQNAMSLANLGWDVDAVDISQTGLDCAAQHALSQGLEVNWICADLDLWIPSKSYDLIVLFRFLDWDTIPSIVQQGLSFEGIFCYETFSQTQMDRLDNHLKSSQFTVQTGDFDQYLPFLSVLRSENTKLVDRDVARFLGRLSAT